jgi:hypothetical protein
VLQQSLKENHPIAPLSAKQLQAAGMDASRGFAVSAAPAAAAAASGNSYFTDQKKGEVNELKQVCFTL